MRDPFHDLPETAKMAGDVLSIATLLGSLASFLPAVAAILTIIWTTIRIYETATVQKFFGKEGMDDES
jgi:hypothetical protein